MRHFRINNELNLVWVGLIFVAGMQVHVNAQDPSVSNLGARDDKTTQSVSNRVGNATASAASEVVSTNSVAESRAIDLASAVEQTEVANLRLMKQCQVKRISFECQDMPLETVMAQISLKTGFPIWIEEGNLDDAGIPIDEPISIRMKDTPVARLLERIGFDLDLTWIVANEKIVITTNDIANDPAKMTQQVSDVEKLFKWFVSHSADLNASTAAQFRQSSVASRKDAVSESVDSFLNLIMSPISVDFEVNDGEGGSLSLAGGQLISTANPVGHRTIEDLLRIWKNLISQPPTKRVYVVNERGFGAPENPSVWKKLEEPIKVAYQDAPLKLVGEELSKRTGIPIVFCQIALEDAGVPMDEPITWDSQGSFYGALRAILDPLDLDFWVCDGEIIIATRDIVACTPFPAIYDVRDLKELLTRDEILNSIETVDRWDEYDAQFHEIGGLVFIVQTQHVHCRIARLLNQLRRKAKPAASQHLAKTIEKHKADTKISTRFYKTRSTEEITALRTAIVSFVAPDSWETNGGEGIIHEVGTTLIVKQTSQVHAKLTTFLANIATAKPASETSNKAEASSLVR
jgi:hypothetical protein